MDAEYIADWIDSRLRSAGIKAAKLGAIIVGAAGPRTRDVVQVARKCFDLTHSKGVATSDDIDEAFKAYQRLVARHPFFSKEHSPEHVRSMMIPDYTINHLKELEGVVDGLEAGYSSKTIL